MKQPPNLLPAWLQAGRSRRNESILVTPCDLLSSVGLKAVSAAPAASIRVTRGNYTWSIPVRLFCALERDES